MEDFTNITFGISKKKKESVKVIGVGGGGSNAVNHMFDTAIKGVGFLVCNTDAQALDRSKVPVKICLGDSLTEGMGAGADPEIGKKAAEENIVRIEKIINKQTKMVFVIAGMGGGTGTGAAPVIAKLAKERGILTVGIVTRPFLSEGASRTKQAQEGIENLKPCVDSLIVLNNNKLIESYGSLPVKEAFAKVDEVLCTAVTVIANIITNHYRENIDLNDTRSVLENSVTAIIGSATASGKDRAKKAIQKALDSPLSDSNKIKGAKKALLLIESSEEKGVTIDEMEEISRHLQIESVDGLDIIKGFGNNLNLKGDTLSVTVIAAGFPSEKQDAILNIKKQTVYTLENEQKVDVKFEDKPTIFKSNGARFIDGKHDEKRIKHTQKYNVEKQKKDSSKENFDVKQPPIENTLGTLQNETFSEKDNKDPALAFELKTLDEPVVQEVQKEKAKSNLHQKKWVKTIGNQDLDVMYEVPAWKRRGVDLEEPRHTEISRTSLEIDKEGNIDFHTNNSFLHDNVD